MMNPFLQFPPEKADKKRTEMNEALAEQVNRNLANNASSPVNLGFWTGNLLIRIGKKLTERETKLNTSKEHA